MLASFAENSWHALSANWPWKPIFGLFESGRFTQVLLYMVNQNILTEYDENACGEQIHKQVGRQATRLVQNQYRPGTLTFKVKIIPWEIILAPKHRVG